MKKKLGRSILKEDKQKGKKISSSTGISDVRETLFVIQSDRLDRYMTLQNDNTEQLDILMECYQMVKTYWLVARRSRSMVIKKCVVVCGGAIEVKKI